MTLKEYFLKMQEFMLNNPESHNLEVVYSKDDEGNGFSYVHGEVPTIGFMYDDGGFVDQRLFEDRGIEPDQLNAVCIN